MEVTTNFRPCTEAELLNLIAKHKTPPDAHIDFLTHPDTRFAIYDALSISDENKDPAGWLEGVYRGAQLGVWSRWCIPTPYGIVSCVYSLEVPPGVIKYLGRNKALGDVVDTIDLRLEPE